MMVRRKRSHPRAVFRDTFDYLIQDNCTEQDRVCFQRYELGLK